ncbi:CDP-diacylglycerol--glycerol-3-phosphate 3-phosphatidyltransferase, mitochondrial [Coccinella septempunctata]|uniref:CDP-diacylglycerol--glycerol-3-phosphate 3-phosphatidyltransferase, mitochondrial n=1 Tax=Coccinella septempunctata TaxID=41139 RepID=UPI001D0761EE|nr:CDP-diacylglycerol--glycerol-3-phosphate 3-phosphatidyltransferase, mitochondrial [Coccinella septempunctata]XP_044759734.1 CDP-diacylglycerol--glycerol-3-phosphate 3-phosphatidyltransferase, mitochondrial [Coccinella septempunctata]
MIRRILSNVFETTVQNEGVVHHKPFTKTETIPFEWLTNVAPCFPVKSSNISILNGPHQFYDVLLRYSETASERITLASLYFGNGKLEKEIVERIMSNINFKEKKMNVNILLDYTRGSRYSDNSRTALLPLLKQNSENCRISLYHTPVLRGVLKKVLPHRWNELLGLQHMKLYIFDDTLLISGANLSNDYFTNRQDRYFLIKDKKICNFYSGLIQRVQMFSFAMDSNNNINLNSKWQVSPFEGDKKRFVEEAGELVDSYLLEAKEEQNSHKTEGNDTWIFPLVQMGQLGVEQDALVTEKLMRKAPSNSKLKIATGYFNLTQDYMNNLIHNTEADCDILMAHPKANGFLGAKGIAGDIPYAYCLIAQKFKKKFKKFGQEERISLIEYLRDGWTYHGKGLWYYPPNAKYPCLTLIGSPNFGERSVKRDLETQLAILTENEELQRKMHEECQSLYKFGLPMEENRAVPKWVHGFVYIFRTYF